MPMLLVLVFSLLLLFDRFAGDHDFMIEMIRQLNCRTAQAKRLSISARNRVLAQFVTLLQASRHHHRFTCSIPITGFLSLSLCPTAAAQPYAQNSNQEKSQNSGFLKSPLTSDNLSAILSAGQ